MRTNDLGSAFELRRGAVERINAQGAQYYKVTGEIEVPGTGEATHTVQFPCLFSEKPAFSFGPELVPGVLVVRGSLPSGNMCVLKWHETIRDDGTVIFSGADFAMTMTGTADQAMIFQWHMEGIGLRGPTGEDPE